jgi:TonB family protein
MQKCGTARLPVERILDALFVNAQTAYVFASFPFLLSPLQFPAMTTRRRAYRLLRAAAALYFVLVAFPARSRAANDLEDHLRAEYSGKTFILRNFYRGERVSYDSAGTRDNPAASGDWTVDGFVRVTSLRLSGQRLTLQAERLSLGNCGEGCGFQPFAGRKEDKKKLEKENKLRIEVALDRGITAQKADAALSRVFLTSQDHLVDLVPDYWKPCVRAVTTGKGGKQYSSCRFPQELASVPGVSGPENSAETESGKPGDANPSTEAVAHIGGGVTAPRLLSNKPPEFSDEARRSKYQGTAVLSITVDKMGQVQNIRIQKPLGLGLDRKAVEAVSKWQFEPASKNGQPVAAELVIETTFNLY